MQFLGKCLALKNILLFVLAVNVGIGHDTVVSSHTYRIVTLPKIAKSDSTKNF